MVEKARIRLIGTDPKELDRICREIKEIALKTGVRISGPIPLPTKKLRISVRKTPCGDGSETYETWQMRIHKRLIDLDADERTLRRIMRVQVPPDIRIEIELI